MELKTYLKEAEVNLKKGKSLLPTLILEGEKKKGIVGIMFPKKELDKRIAFFKLGEKIANDFPDKIENVIFVSEIWYKKFKEGEEIEKPIKEYSDKKEAIFIVSLDRNGKVEILIKEFFRKGKEIKFGEIIEKPEKIKPYILKEFWSGYYWGGGK